ncbi:MAG: GGDEF domain-containing protein, partial [Clostridia bacterium]|nr:GGDEF domain-containing protein [Clostridia bacterium]
ILCTVSIWGHFIFSVDSNNLYHREDWYYLMMAGVFFPVGYIFVKLVLKYAKTFNRILKDNKMIILLLIINIIVPIGLIVLQGMNVTNVAVIFPFITLSTVIMHLITMANTAGTDFLTKLKNNFGVNKHFAYFPKITNYYYAIVFFDLNNFKFINDKFGHKEGDEVLKAFAEILAKEIKSGDIAARHGGDEFFIGVTLKDPEELDSIIKSIQAEVNKYNQTVKNYKMSFSYGISINKPRHSLNYEQLINEADEKMYSNKSISKQLELDI